MPPTRDAVELHIDLPGVEFTAGARIPLSCRIENRSSRQVTLWSAGFWTNHSVRVTDASDREPPLTALGRQRRDAFAPDGPRDKNAPHTLDPGESRSCGAEVDLATLFELGPGRYRVEVRYDDRQPPTPLALVSDSLSFTLLP
jgi:hypothetical protein